MSLRPKNNQTSGTSITLDRIFEISYTAVDVKRQTFFNTDNGLRLEFDYQMYLIHKQIQWFTIYSSRSSSPTEGNHCETQALVDSELLEYSSILVRKKQRFMTTFCSPIPVTNITEQEIERRYHGNMPILHPLREKKTSLGTNHLLPSWPSQEDLF